MEETVVDEHEEHSTGKAGHDPNEHRKSVPEDRVCSKVPQHYQRRVFQEGNDVVGGVLVPSWLVLFG